MSDVTLVWFKRDLRVTDHPALALAAAQGGTVVPVYIVEPDYWALPDTSARQWDFTRECVDGLARALDRMGAPLVIRVGDAVAEMEHLRAKTGAKRLISHEETGNGWTYARDRRMAEWARGQGVAWTELPQSGVVRRLTTRDGWAARREGVLRQPQVDVPAMLSGRPDLDRHALPDADELRMRPDPCPGRQIGGRDQALSLLGSFLTERWQTYRSAMSSPLEGEWACSRLSPHLALGTVSVREAAQASAARRDEVAGTRSSWAGSLKSFASRLAWRDHFMQKLEDEPALEHRCLHPAYEGLRPRDPDPDLFQAWASGQTGLPFVDACMRYLIHTGWLNFRMRSMLMAVASYHLWLDWRVTGAHLARMFTDYEPGIHWSQCQMQSGTTGMNTIRIYNPIKQGHDQDPTGAFTRCWVPELAPVPDAVLQEPWRWDGAGTVLGRTYPVPVVDVTAAARAARDRVWAVRKGDGFREDAARVIRKHASRKDSAGHFVNDRAPRKPRSKSDKQLSFDL